MLKKTIDEIENEWKNYLRRSRLSYVTSSLLKFYDILEEMVNDNSNKFSFLIPFFLETGKWIVRSMERTRKAAKTEELDEVNQQFSGKVVENVIQNEQGQWVLVMDGKPTSFIWKG